MHVDVTKASKFFPFFVGIFYMIEHFDYLFYYSV